MKKLAIALLLILLTALAFITILRHNQPPPKQASAPVIKNTYKKACSVFTLSDAQSVLGQGATQTPSHTDSITAQKSITSCLYTYDPGSFSDVVVASVQLQGSVPAQAKTSFTDARPANAQDVSGYGDQAYWDPNLGQLQIVKGQYWLIISGGSGPASQRDQDLPRKIADIIIKRL